MTFVDNSWQVGTDRRRQLIVLIGGDGMQKYCGRSNFPEENLII